MLSTKKIVEIELVCHAIVGDMMAMMLNPRYRGDKFTWEYFPEMMAKKCRVQVMVSVVMSDRMRLKCQKHAENIGRNVAASWIKKMTE